MAVVLACPLTCVATESEQVYRPRTAVKSDRQAEPPLATLVGSCSTEQRHLAVATRPLPGPALHLPSGHLPAAAECLPPCWLQE